MEGITKWPEKTTTSPLGCHLGIYKSLHKHVCEKEKQKDSEALATPAAHMTQGCDILYLIFDVMAITLKHSYPLNRWKVIWTIFIIKEMGNSHINLLCCIVIFEADWQLLLKWHLSYSFLKCTELAGTLTNAQGSGRKGHSAIDQAAQHIVKTEIVHLQQNQQ